MKNQAERRQLCSEAALFKDRLFRAGLFLTAQKMDVVCKEIGYECASQFQKEERHDQEA